MPESELCSPRIFSSFREESGDEELAVLPRHTKVIVTGNNRTKSVLVGLQGIVKKAVGLGGWHWLVLKNGIEVKLQRNALSILEHPTGDEVDEDVDFDASSGSEIGQKHYDCSRGSKINGSRVRHTKPWFPSAPVKSTNHSSYGDVQSIIQAHQPNFNFYEDALMVNFGKLGTETLWRYIKHYKLCGVNRESPREQMLKAIQQHFLSQGPLDEVQVLTEFVRAAKKQKSV